LKLKYDDQLANLLSISTCAVTAGRGVRCREHHPCRRHRDGLLRHHGRVLSTPGQHSIHIRSTPNQHPINTPSTPFQHPINTLSTPSPPTPPSCAASPSWQGPTNIRSTPYQHSVNKLLSTPDPYPINTPSTPYQHPINTLSTPHQHPINTIPADATLLRCFAIMAGPLNGGRRIVAAMSCLTAVFQLFHSQVDKLSSVLCD